MNCKEMKKLIELYDDEELEIPEVYDKVKLHLENCKECRAHLSSVKRTKEVIAELKKSQLKQYQLLKKDNREFNNELWTKIIKEKNKPKPLTFVWFEVAIVLLFIGISIWNYKILSKELILIMGIIFMTIGMGYTNYKEVQNNE